jgi:hypothetical protein
VNYDRRAQNEDESQSTDYVISHTETLLTVYEVTLKPTGPTSG